MKIKKVGKLLKKINNLFDNIKEEGTISSIEKDLFLAYIKEIYEASIDKEDSGKQELSQVKESVQAAPVVEVAVVEDAPVTLSDIPTEDVEETDLVAQVEKPVVDSPKLDERELRKLRREEERRKREEERQLRLEQRKSRRSDSGTPVKPTESKSINESLSANGLQETSNNQTAVAPPVQEVYNEPEEELIVEEPTSFNTPVSFSEEMLTIFEKQEINEVSDRLSMTPIADLTKAMGINEKIFTVRELFNKDQDRFMATMNHLNTCPDFEAAKDYLMNGVATENGWDDPNKSKKAVNFIKLVQRRYNK